MKRKGFTLVELLIVVGIIGILVAISIPAYQNIVTRVRVVEGLAFVGPAKLAVIESTAANQGALPATQEDTRYKGPAPTENVESVKIADDGSGQIIINYTDLAGGGTIIFEPALDEEKNFTWSCTKGTLENRYRPANCR